MVQLLLGAGPLTRHRLTEEAQCLRVRVAEVAQIGGVDLGVAVELADVSLDKGRVQEGGQPASQVGGQAFVAAVKDVQMVLEGNPRPRRNRRVADRCPDAPALLLGRQPLHQDIGPVGEQQLLREVGATASAFGLRLGSAAGHRIPSSLK